MNLVIDIGNTLAKLVVFDGGEPVYEEYTSNASLDALARVARTYRPQRAVVSTVVDLAPAARRALDGLSVPMLRVDGNTPVPLEVLYHTPHTLGADRLAAVVGAVTLRPGCNLLIVDAGTCVTYELVEASGRYLGGNISPGLDMRLRALHEHTGRLPLVDPDGPLPPLGYDTPTAIRSGVVRGLRLEIEGYIHRYREKYPDLFVFLTGGTRLDFDDRLKNCIFADKYLVPRGLNRILEYNDQPQR